MRVTAISLAALALVCTTVMAQEFSVYKWVDEDGVPHYTDRPQASEEAMRTGIRSQRTDPNAVMARVEEETAQRAEQNAAQAERTEADDQAEAERRETEAQRKENCQQARERAATYNDARRLYRPMEGGGREYLTDQELSSAREAADAAVSTWCD